MDMEWAAHTASTHPHLHDAFINIDGQWLDILLADGRSFRFRPSQMIDAHLPLEKQRILLDKLISIGVANAEPSTKVEEKDEKEGNKYARDNTNLTDSPHASHTTSSPTSHTSKLSTPRLDDLPHNEKPRSQNTHNHPYERLTFPPLDLNNPDSVLDHLVPVVRSADFFLASHDQVRQDSMVYMPLTPFLAAGLSVESSHASHPLFLSDLHTLGLSTDITDLFQAALAHIRSPFISEDEGLTMKLELRPRNGAQVYEFTGPINHRCAWFLDVEVAHFTAMLPHRENPDILPLFIPAQRDHLYIVAADDPALPAFLSSLADTLDPAAPFYPLPHVITDDGWSEWIPLPDHPAAPILARIRTLARARIYRAQSEAMARWPEDFGMLMPYDPGLHQKTYSSYTRWSSRTSHGSVPDTDFIILMREKSPHPWDNDTSDGVLLRSRVARDVWHEGFSLMPNIWPPRWTVNGFPDEAQFAALKEAADREI